MLQLIKEKSPFVRSMILIIIVLISAFFILLTKDERNTPVISPPSVAPQIPALPKTLSDIDEAKLQQQLKEILATKKEENCSALADPRYQAACHDLFKNVNPQ